MRQGTYGAVAAFQDETGQEHPRMSQWWMGLLQVGNADIKRDTLLRWIKRFFIRSNSSDWVYKVTAALSFCCSFWHFCHYSANLDLWFLLPAATLRAHNLDSNSCSISRRLPSKRSPTPGRTPRRRCEDIATFSSVFVQIGWGALPLLPMVKKCVKLNELKFLFPLSKLYLCGKPAVPPLSCSLSRAISRG